VYSYLAYVDEAGDEGFSFDKGSSDWFILSAAVTRRENDMEVVRLVDDVRAKLKKDHRFMLHFKELSHQQRLFLVDLVGKARLRLVNIAIHKPSLEEKEKFAEKSRLYFYAMRLLLERLSWLCRDHSRPWEAADGKIKIVMSNRSSMSYDELREYLNRLKVQSESQDIRIDWKHIEPSLVISQPARNLMGLQIADAVAGSVYSALQKSAFGFIEDRYLRMLSKVFYRARGRTNGYGIKFYPSKAEELVKEDQLFAWFRLFQV